jgi:16S rRNA C1402 (ribose-2'-O) methylase RsmI
MEENVRIGQQHEFQRIYEMTERLKKELDDFKKQATDKEVAKDQEVRKLQEAMGVMQDENISLRQENGSELSVLSRSYKDVLEGASSTRALLDLDKIPPSEAAVEGALVILKTMFSKPTSEYP